MYLPYSFYQRHVINVAQELLGKRLIFNNKIGVITETEAYRGGDDEASHAYRGPTKRAAVMYGPPGVSYVYLIYGIHHCLNIVAEEEGQAAAVLIRGAMFGEHRLDGPGKLCRYLGINLAHNGINLVNNQNFTVAEGEPIKQFEATSRIGIRRATDKQWRFIAV